MLVSQVELWSIVAGIFIVPLAVVAGAILIIWLRQRNRYRPDTASSDTPRSVNATESTESKEPAEKMTTR